MGLRFAKARASAQERRGASRPERICRAGAARSRRAFPRSEATRRRPLEPAGSRPQLDRNPEAIVNLAACDCLTNTANRFLMGASTEAGLSQPARNCRSKTGTHRIGWLVGILNVVSPMAIVSERRANRPRAVRTLLRILAMEREGLGLFLPERTGDFDLSDFDLSVDFSLLID
jgi:hypothetical protein